MNKTLQALLGSAVALALMGQGCAMTQQTQLEGSADADTQVDASIDAMIKAEEDATVEEREGDTDGDKLDQSAELDVYSETQYEIQ